MTRKIVKRSTFLQPHTSLPLHGQVRRCWDKYIPSYKGISCFGAIPPQRRGFKSWAWYLYTHGCNTSNRTWFQNRTRMTLTWFEHAAFWSGVRRATVAPQSLPWRRRPLALRKRKITNVAYKAEISTDLQKFFLARAWQDSNLQSPDPKSGALSIRPHTLQMSAPLETRNHSLGNAVSHKKQ